MFLVSMSLPLVCVHSKCRRVIVASNVGSISCKIDILFVIDVFNFSNLHEFGTRSRLNFDQQFNLEYVLFRLI